MLDMLSRRRVRRRRGEGSQRAGRKSGEMAAAVQLITQGEAGDFVDIAGIRSGPKILHDGQCSEALCPGGGVRSEIVV